MPALGPIAVILNAGAGIAKARPEISRELTDLFRGVGLDAEIVMVQAGQDPVQAARDVAARVSIVVAAGGDGTIGSVAAGILDSPATLGILALGSRNHFAMDLHIPLDAGEAVASIAAGRTIKVDVGLVNDRAFINNSSIGIYASMVETREELRERGHRKWPAMLIATWQMFRSYPGMTVTIEAGGDVRTWRTPFVFVGNNAYTLDGLKVGGRDRIDEGKLYAYVTPSLHSRDLPGLVFKSVLGRTERSGEVQVVSGCELTIGTKSRRVHVAVDGEIESMTQPLRYRARPGALRVIVPARSA
jgi:diacylglycerol kinase family enzyme